MSLTLKVCRSQALGRMCYNLCVHVVDCTHKGCCFKLAPWSGGGFWSICMAGMLSTLSQTQLGDFLGWTSLPPILHTGSSLMWTLSGDRLSVNLNPSHTWVSTWDSADGLPLSSLSSVSRKQPCALCWLPPLSQHPVYLLGLHFGNLAYPSPIGAGIAKLLGRWVPRQGSGKTKYSEALCWCLFKPPHCTISS